MTGVMEQYFEVKDRYHDCLLFFRLGDFYELFFDDAVTASALLGLTLTGRDIGGGERAKMCGVPRHSLEQYLSKLAGLGYKAAVCEQLDEPGGSGGVLRREVTRVVTPGTLTDESALDERSNNYLMCVFEDAGYGLACADITTGEFRITDFSASEYKKVFDEIAKLNPKELVTNAGFSRAADIKRQFGLDCQALPDKIFGIKAAEKRLAEDPRFRDLRRFGFGENLDGVRAAGGLYYYIEYTQKDCLNFIRNIRYYSKNRYLGIDAGSRRNLELTASLRDGGRKATLLSVLDKTRTPMGARCLRRWLEQPLTDPEQINRRLDAVDALLRGDEARARLMDLLGGVKDLERLAMRVALEDVGAAQLCAVAASLGPLPGIKQLIPAQTGLLKELASAFDDLSDIGAELARALPNSPDDDQAADALGRGIKRLVNKGFSDEYDAAFEAAAGLNERVGQLEEKERGRTGNKNLKISNNKAFGYYIELSRSAQNIPADYIRRQTLTGSERYVTQELLELESGLALVGQRLSECGERAMRSVFDALRRQINRLQLTSYMAATLDALCSLAQAARENGYVRPAVISGAPDTSDQGVIDIVGGRHPVVELMTEGYVPNDTYLGEGRSLAIITGPNMAGKSTYMRQTAQIIIMAQMGGFVPASYAKISVCDKIFTRAGASDDLASGQSTFMVEMNEVANIMENATARSLIILDEVGRGTSTYDGLCIAWSVLEHIVNVIKAKTMFATHYHELTELEGRLPGVHNYSMSLTEKDGVLVYDRRLARKAADGSFGLHAAQVAGMPEGIVQRARQLFDGLNQSGAARRPEPGGIVRYSDGETGFLADIDYNDRFFINEVVRLRKEGVSLRDAVRQILDKENVKGGNGDNQE